MKTTIKIEQDGRNIEMETDSVVLTDILEDFKSALLAAGFSIKGDIIISDEEE